MEIETGASSPIHAGRIRRIRREELSPKRKYVLLVGLLDLFLCSLIALDTYHRTSPLVIKHPKTFGEAAEKVASEVYFIALFYKVIWATGIILVALLCAYENWERNVIKSAFLTGVVIGAALLITIGSTVLSWDDTDDSRMPIYLTHLLLHAVFPTLISVVYII